MTFEDTNPPDEPKKPEPPDEPPTPAPKPDEPTVSTPVYEETPAK